jgi:hypothetical protein
MEWYNDPSTMEPILFPLSLITVFRYSSFTDLKIMLNEANKKMDNSVMISTTLP